VRVDRADTRKNFATGRAAHNKLDIFVTVILITLAASAYFRSKGDPSVATQESDLGRRWSITLTLVVLGLAGETAFVSDWFVDALQPA
jgi:hypothetical protein